MSYKRKAELPIGDKNDLMEVTPLGAGSEVGRSCHVLKYKNKTVLVPIHFMILSDSLNKNICVFPGQNIIVIIIIILTVLLFSYNVHQLDCGIHPGQSGISGLPFFDEVDPATIDVLLITQ